MRYTPENITELGPNEIFVFGSNTGGRHGKGAAWRAKDRFGAQQFVGEGSTGRCYAFPTLDERLGQRTVRELKESATRFKAYAEQNPQLVFLLTRVGCGLAGYEDAFMKTLFRDCPPNVIKPEGW